jgi:hypothetical protein
MECAINYILFLLFFFPFQQGQPEHSTVPGTYIKKALNVAAAQKKPKRIGTVEFHGLKKEQDSH